MKPDVVVVNLGTNDFNGGDPGAPYTAALNTFVDTIRSKYPNAWIFCVVGTMLGDPAHTQAKGYVQSVVTSHGGDGGKIALVDLGIQDALKGTGCDWHPSVPKISGWPTAHAGDQTSSAGRPTLGGYWQNALIGQTAPHGQPLPPGAHLTSTAQLGQLPSEHSQL